MKTLKATLSILLVPAFLSLCFMGPLVSETKTVERASALVSVNR
jgi:hypothetical protein